MLGIIGSFRRWRWAAYGKHPVSRDFFRLGSGNPVADLFADWMERGYPVPGGKERPISSLRIWRFWAKGETKKDFVCGFVRDSNDSLGRPYPLLVIGSGPVDSWEEHWDLVPCVCERTWSHIEYSVTRNISDLKHLEGEIRNTPAPRPDWTGAWNPNAAGADSAHPPGGDAQSFRPIGEQAAPLVQGSGCELYRLNPDPSGSVIDSVVALHRMLRDRLQTVPHAMFIGGSFDATCLVCYRRPLQLGDFAALWSYPDLGGE